MQNQVCHQLQLQRLQLWLRLKWHSEQSTTDGDYSDGTGSDDQYTNVCREVMKSEAVMKMEYWCKDVIILVVIHYTFNHVYLHVYGLTLPYRQVGRRMTSYTSYKLTPPIWTTHLMSLRSSHLPPAIRLVDTSAKCCWVFFLDKKCHF